VIAEHLELDWHQVRIDPRLGEIDVGEWGGLSYRDVVSAAGPVVDRSTGLFAVRPPGGEWYDEIAARLGAWIDEMAAEERDRLIVMHGISSRVLRGMLTGAELRPECGAPVADGLPQGSVVEVADGIERLIAAGDTDDIY
jgi:probable phosphoglycerate mutase